MDLGRLFRRGDHDPAPADDATDRLRAALARLVARTPGDTMLHPPASGAALAHAETHLGRELPDRSIGRRRLRRTPPDGSLAPGQTGR